MHTISRSMIWTAPLVALVLAVTPVAGQKKGDDKKAAAGPDPQQELVGSVVTATNLAMAGEPGVSAYVFDPAAEQRVVADPTTTMTMELHAHYLKASDQKIYVPFTVSLQPGVLGTSGSLAAYLRLAPRGAAAPEATAAPAEPRNDKDPKNDKDKDKKKRGKEAQDMAPVAVSGVQYPWEDLYELSASPASPGGPLTFSRPFSVPAGEYDLYLAVRTRDTTTPLKVAVLKQSLTVPDYWNTEFRTSSVFLASQVTPLDTVPTGDEQKAKPYVIGNLELKPNFDGKFTAADELSVFFIIYNPQLTASRKPDVTVEWQPYKKGPLGEAKFRSVEPQKLTPETLPAGFDVDQGHQLVGSLNLPVSAFEPGDYRLAVKVTDNTNGKTLEHDVPFVVAP